MCGLADQESGLPLFTSAVALFYSFKCRINFRKKYNSLTSIVLNM